MYASVGRPSIPPEQLLRALLLQMLYSIRSERLLVEENRLPSHSSESRGNLFSWRRADSADSVDQSFPRAVQRAFQIKMAMINIAIQEDLPNALALVTRRMKASLLGEPNRWVRCYRGSEDGSLVPN